MDWNRKPEELKRTEEDIDEIDQESKYLNDYLDDIPDLEETGSMTNSVYDRLGATPASTIMSTDTEAARDMLNLSMGLPQVPVSHCLGKLTAPSDKTDTALRDDEQFGDMFKIPSEVPAHWDTTLPKGKKIESLDPHG